MNIPSRIVLVFCLLLPLHVPAVLAEDANTNGLPDDWEAHYFLHDLVTTRHLIAGGDIILKSSAITVNGQIYANGSVRKTCSLDPTINGDISVVGEIEVPPTAGYSSTTGAPPITVPDLRTSFPIWRSRATSGGLYYGSNMAFGAVDLRPTSGVVFVEGDVSFGSNSFIAGTLVATGTITIASEFHHSPFDTNWPVLVAGIDVHLDYGNSFTQTVFAGRDITVDRATPLDILIALGSITIDNSLTPVDPQADADGDGFSNGREYTGGTDPTNSAAYPVTPLWAAASDIGGGWRYLAWFGYFKDVGGTWIWHGEHGWLYPQGTTTASLWLWSGRLGWLLTSDAFYPFVWSDFRHAWLWYYRGTGRGAGGWFYNCATGSTAWY